MSGELEEVQAIIGFRKRQAAGHNYVWSTYPLTSPPQEIRVYEGLVQGRIVNKPLIRPYFWGGTLGGVGGGAILTSIISVYRW